MTKGYIGKRKMNRLRKQYKLKDLEVKLTRLAEIPNIIKRHMKSSNVNNAANLPENELSSSLGQSSSFLSFLSSSRMMEQHAADSPVYITDDLEQFSDMMDGFLKGIPKAQKKDDHYAKDFNSNCEDFISLENCPPYIENKMEETKPIKVSPGKDCNSVSTFIEEEDENTDKPYFRVNSMEVKSDHEICLHGVLVEDHY